jgi:hypothetical protein
MGNRDASFDPDSFRCDRRCGPGGRSSYSAKVAAPTGGRIIAPDIVWNCGAGSCQGATDESRPAVICQSLARKAGKVGSFVADGRDFTSVELEKCNASAKATTGKALAAQ